MSRPPLARFPLLLSATIAAALLLAFACGGGGSPSPARLPGKIYGGAGHDAAWSVVQAPDGGFVFAGWTSSFGAGGYDAWVVRTDSSGRVVRQRTFGGTDNDFAFSVIALPGGGYAVAGVDNVAGPIRSDPSLPPFAHQRYPIDLGGTLTLRRLTADLSDEWPSPAAITSVQVGTSFYPYTLGYSVRLEGDGGFLVAGATSTAVGGGEALLVKTDSTGAILWKSYPTGGEIVTGTVPTPGGGYALSCGGNGNLVLAGATGSFVDNLLVAFDLHAVLATPGGFAVAGESWGGDAFLGEVNGTATGLVWGTAFGSPGGDAFFSMAGTADHGFVLAGMGSGGGFDHRFDAYAVRTDGSGNSVWATYFGGLGNDYARGVSPTSDGGFVIAGLTESAGAGGYDGWLIRTDRDGTALW